MNKDTVKYSVEHDYIKKETTYSVTINDRAALLMDLDPLDRVILDSKIESTADFAQSLETVLRAIERGMAIERDMAELKLEVEK